ncbi:MAG: endonuclease III domain-containing protein [Candidatus Omnitrophica bacterium]|nr:endonuclease III domain-containing protein [Candidatus Omnitrophota bacterium]
MRSKVSLIYRKLYDNFGPQAWWPADSPFEVMIGAILTQNTSWVNVEKALINIKQRNLLDPRKLYKLRDKEFARLIRPAGYYNIKTKRLKAFLNFFISKYSANVKKLSLLRTNYLRKELLSVKGIGPETADSILLYALNKPVFVIDAYTLRIFSRHNQLKEDVSYDEAQEFFMRSLSRNAKLFNEYHALIVKLGKDYCRKTKPKCRACPLRKCFNSGGFL